MRRASSASQQLTEESNRRTPQEEKAIWIERQRNLTIQNQPLTMNAQEWMRSKGVQGRPGSAEWREGRRALIEEYRTKPKAQDKQWARGILSDAEAGESFSFFQLALANGAMRLLVL